MSKINARQAVRTALSQMSGHAVLVDPRSSANLSEHFMSMLMCDDDDYAEKAQAEMKDMLCSTYGVGQAQTDKEFAFANGTAIIPIHGSLINRYGGYYFGMVTGYNFIRRQAAAASIDPDVERIIFDVNSGGGQAAGCFELSAELAQIEKPTLAVVDSNCYSAAYALASAADQIAVTPSGGAGSVGVISMHVDMSKLLNDIGINITLITAGEHKADGHPFGPLPDDVKAEMQADINQCYDQFVSLVAANRGIDEKTVRDTEARCYSAQDALGLNLIDIVATPNQAATAFISGPSGSDNETLEDEPMPQEATNNQPDNQQLNAGATEAALSAARAEGATAERARISAITSCEAAKTRPALANHIAFNTSMSVEDANTMLSAAGAETQATAPANKEPDANANTNFMNAMNNGDHPNVGNEGNNSKAQEDGDLEASLASTGFKFN